MKRCPQCYQPYADSERFCELDGQQLLNDISATSPVGKVVDTQTAVLDASAQKREMRMMVIIGVMVGMIVTSLGYAGYSLFLVNPAEESDVPVSRVEPVDTRQPTQPTRSAIREPSPAPEEEASPSPEAEAEAVEEETAKAETTAAHLNQGPVSTGERESQRETVCSDGFKAPVSPVSFKAAFPLEFGVPPDHISFGLWHMSDAMI